MDSVLTVTRDADGRRYLEADGRDVFMPSTRLEFFEGRISFGQCQLAEPAHDACAQLLAAIKAHPGELTRTDAIEKAGIRKQTGLRFARADGAGGRHPLEAARGSPWTDPVASGR